jgi:ribosome-binding factor A
MRRKERVADSLKEEIAQIVGYELEDPRLTMVTVTDVRLSADKRAARVYVTVAGDEEEHKLALAALKRATPYVRKQLGLSLNRKASASINCYTRSSRNGKVKEREMSDCEMRIAELRISGVNEIAILEFAFRNSQLCLVK